MIKERRPSPAPGSIHCPVRLMKDILARKDTKAIETMIHQLRAGYADPSRSDYEKGGYLWLGKRYAAAYREIAENAMQVIFQSKNGPNGQWLDYCRESVPENKNPKQWAEWQSKKLKNEIGCDFRFRLENWH